MADIPVITKKGFQNSDLENVLNRYLDLFENAPIGIFQSTLETNQFINVNLSMARLLGYETKEECISSVQDIARDIYVQPQRRQCLLAKTLNKGQLMNFEDKFRRADGSVFIGKVHARIVRKKEGSIAYLEGFFEDISNQKKILNQLKHSEKHYRSIFDNTGTGTLIVEDDMTISLVNEEFLRMSGYERCEVEGRMKWPQIVAFPEDLVKMKTYHRQRRERQGTIPNDYEFTLVDKQGNRKNVLARVDVIPGTGRSVGSFNDITQMVKARQSLRENEAKAREEFFFKENIKLRAAMRERYQFCGIVGKSRVMQRVYELILRAASTDVTIVIYGESGTGKELVARAIHRMSDRSKKNFVPVNCSAIPEKLSESEFFGVKKGAFTGAVKDRPGFFDHAEKGTLFLDELGDMDLNIQVKLLRVLEGSGFTPVGSRQLKKTDVRIVAATNRDLNRLVRQGVMREDFFYRIHILPIYLPPLRERKEDIPLLVEHFLEKHAVKKKKITLPGMMLEALQAHDWPGNVRELENTLQRYINLDNLEFLSSPAQPDARGVGNWPLQSGTRSGQPLRQALNRFEKDYITQMLDQHQWNRQDTADALSIGRKTLYMKMKAFGIEKRVKNTPPG